MKKSFLVILSLIIISCNGDKNAINIIEDINDKNEKGDIDKIVLQNYFVDDTEGQSKRGDFGGSKVYEYNENQMLETYIRYDFQNSPVEKLTFSYDDSNRLIRKNIYGYEQYGIDKGHVSLSSYSLYQYLDDGKLLTIETNDANNQLTGKETYAYNREGNISEISKNDMQSMRKQKSVIQWGEDNVLEYVDYYSDSGDLKLSGKRTQVYNGDGKLIEQKNYSAKSLYNGSIKYSYDEVGNVLDEKQINTDGTLSYQKKNKYENFDEKGNWLTMTIYANGQAQTILEREIYYKGSKDDSGIVGKENARGGLTPEKPTTPSKIVDQGLDKEEDGVMSLKELQLALVGSGYKKAKLILGYYDDMGWSGSDLLDCVIFKDKVRDGGKIKNLVLILRWGKHLDWSSVTIDEVMAVSDGQTFRCGLTPWKIYDGKLDK